MFKCYLCSRELFEAVNCLSTCVDVESTLYFRLIVSVGVLGGRRGQGGGLGSIVLGGRGWGVGGGCMGTVGDW